MVTDQTDVSADLERDFARVMADFPQVAAAWLFGSVARGDACPASDIDVAILFRNRRATRLEHHRLLGEIASRLEEVVAPRSLDLSVLDAGEPIFCHQVLCGGRRLLDADPVRRADFESEVYSRYLDFRPTWDIATRGRIRGLRRWLASRK